MIQRWRHILAQAERDLDQRRFDHLLGLAVVLVAALDLLALAVVTP